MPYSNEKIRKSIYIDNLIWNLIDSYIKQANCNSKNEFIIHAINFYCGYLNQEKNSSFITTELESILKSSVQITEDRLAKVIFKLAVEMSMMMNVMSANLNIDQNQLTQLRGKCVRDVKSSIGKVNLDSVSKYQSE